MNNNVEIDPKTYLKDLIIDEIEINSFEPIIIENIIADAYDAVNPMITIITKKLNTKYSFFLGRVQKNQLKRYLDYKRDNDFDLFIRLTNETKIINKKEKIKEIIDNIHNSEHEYKEKYVKTFLEKLSQAISDNNVKRIKDYLIFLYSRLLNLNELELISLNYLFTENKIKIRKELNQDYYKELQSFCISKRKEKREFVVKKFNKKYLEMINNQKEHSDIMQNALIYLNIDQNLFNKFKTKENFHSYLFDIIKLLYKQIENHKALVIHINNIMDQNINIKWEVYSYLVIYCEKFKEYQESRQYYSPEIIFKDCYEFKFEKTIDDNNIKFFKNYFKGKISFKQLVEDTKIENLDKLQVYIDSFKKINTGFTFIDTFILKTNQMQPNTKEIDFIDNQVELLLVFFKNELNDYRIPCPLCGSLKISGNSFPEIGIRSWECKNPYCAERSKTNRGKRYSIKAIQMQDSLYDFTSENIIPKRIISQWRRDVVDSWNLENLYIMLTKYYSYPGDYITTINCDNEILFYQIAQKENRKLITKHLSEFLPFSETTNTSKAFFNSEINPFFDKFLYDQRINFNKTDDLSFIFDNPERLKILKGNSNKLLHYFERESIHHLVTSPPYYNAREYTQWSNLFNYLNDLYHNIKGAYSVLKCYC
ncbi:MAG: DNA-methyltransferase [Candidatus Hodarchaeales archaeon]